MKKLMKTLLHTTYKLEDIARVIDHLIRYMREYDTTREWQVGVNGELGAGKTTLFQAFLRELSLGEAAGGGQSPTYVYLKPYESKDISLWHVDAYRLAKPVWNEIMAAWEEGMDERKYVLWVEWYGLVTDEPPDILITLSHDAHDPLKRYIKIEAL